MADPLPRAVRSQGTAPDPARLSVGFILAQNFTLSAFSLFIDQLRLASDEGDRSRQILCHWTVMTRRQAPVRASCGVMVAGTGDLTDPRQFNYIVVVGGLLHAGPQLDEAGIAYLKQAGNAASAGITARILPPSSPIWNRLRTGCSWRTGTGSPAPAAAVPRI
jgi:transcriptional regulator GlxA family with amidase domain